MYVCELVKLENVFVLSRDAKWSKIKKTYYWIQIKYHIQKVIIIEYSLSSPWLSICLKVLSNSKSITAPFISNRIFFADGTTGSCWVHMSGVAFAWRCVRVTQVTDVFISVGYLCQRCEISSSHVLFPFKVLSSAFFYPVSHRI